MKKRNYIIIGMIILVVVIGIVIYLFVRKDKKVLDNSEQNNTVDNTITNNTEDDIVTEEEIEEIENIKNEINATGNNDIYQVEEEYDGRKILQVKPDVQFDVDLAGIIKSSIPKESEITGLLRQAPNNNGIWISEQSRESFSNLLRNNNIDNFTISEDGYLQIDSNLENSDVINKLMNMINSDKLYIINMTGIAYERDYISGEIVEYPFEDMDPYQIIESYQKENKIILEITTNKNKQLTEKEILETIIAY